MFLIIRYTFKYAYLKSAMWLKALKHRGGRANLSEWAIILFDLRSITLPKKIICSGSKRTEFTIYTFMMNHLHRQSTSSIINYITLRRSFQLYVAQTTTDLQTSINNWLWITSNYDEMYEDIYKMKCGGRGTGGRESYTGMEMASLLCYKANMRYDWWMNDDRKWWVFWNLITLGFLLLPSST